MNEIQEWGIGEIIIPSKHCTQEKSYQSAIFSTKNSIHWSRINPRLLCQDSNLHSISKYLAMYSEGRSIQCATLRTINCPGTETGCMSWDLATNCLCYGTFIHPPYQHINKAGMFMAVYASACRIHNSQTRCYQQSIPIHGFL
jgi:hypothetical protein